MTEKENQARREFAEEVVRRLRDAGFQSLWAGGCVRDLILGHPPIDYDVATDARPEQVMDVLPFRTIPVGISFGVVRVNHPRRRGIEVEVATFRNDGDYLDGRRPDSVVFSTAEEDAARRDFTINGMFLDPLSGEVIDYVGGREDLEQRKLRAIGEPSARFREDKLRLLRAIRFASRFSLTIEPTTLDALRAMASEVTAVSPERIAQELKRMLVHPSRSSAMTLARETGLLLSVLPELIPLQHRWERTLRVLDALPEHPPFTLAFAALVLDLDTSTVDAVCRTLRFSNMERERIVWLVASQSDLETAQSLPRARLKRILAHSSIDELLAISRAIAFADSGDLAPIAFCEAYLRDRPEGPINPPPLITGGDLISHGLKPGRRFAEILDSVRDAQLEGSIHTKEEALAWLDSRSAG